MQTPSSPSDPKGPERQVSGSSLPNWVAAPILITIAIVLIYGTVYCVGQVILWTKKKPNTSSQYYSIAQDKRPTLKFEYPYHFRKDGESHLEYSQRLRKEAS